MVWSKKNNGQTNFYECCDLTEKIYLIYTRQFIILHWDCNMHHARIIYKGQDHFYKNFTFFRKKDLQNINHSSLSVHALYTVLTTFLNVGRAGKLFPWEQQKNPGKKEPDAQNLLHFFVIFANITMFVVHLFIAH